MCKLCRSLPFSSHNFRSNPSIIAAFLAPNTYVVKDDFLNFLLPFPKVHDISRSRNSDQKTDLLPWKCSTIYLRLPPGALPFQGVIKVAMTKIPSAGLLKTIAVLQGFLYS
jgi:hypothetical protein